MHLYLYVYLRRLNLNFLDRQCSDELELFQVPSTMEICLVAKSSAASQYPGIYLFTTVARMMRPVWNYSSRSVELIGTFEQVYLNIAVTDTEAQQTVSVT